MKSAKTIENVQFWARLACLISRKHLAIAGQALAQYGEYGHLVSYCVRDHFPERVRNQLRAHAKAVAKCLDRMHACRPRGMHRASVLKLGKQAAQMYGSGWYGYQTRYAGNIGKLES